jgi:hypothetical protein
MIALPAGILAKAREIGANGYDADSMRTLCAGAERMAEYLWPRIEKAEARVEKLEKVMEAAQKHNDRCDSDYDKELTAALADAKEAK